MQTRESIQFFQSRACDDDDDDDMSRKTMQPTIRGKKGRRKDEKRGQRREKEGGREAGRSECRSRRRAVRFGSSWATNFKATSEESPFVRVSTLSTPPSSVEPRQLAMPALPQSELHRTGPQIKSSNWRALRGISGESPPPPLPPCAPRSALAV